MTRPTPALRAAGPDVGVATRTAAWKAVRAVHAEGTWATRAVDAALRRTSLDERDRAFAANLAYEALRWEGTLDWALAQVLTRPLDAVQPELLDVLRIGAWQLLRGGTPDSAAVDTAVEVARREVGPGTAGFCNGVLRALARRRDELPWPPVADDRGLALALGYPAWIVEQARARFGDDARAVLEGGNVPAGVTLRATGDRDALVAELIDLGIAARPGLLAPESVRAPGADPGRLAAVREGRATPQDEASMVVAHAVADGLPPGARVIDVCAAPGGKATHLAQLGLQVVAVDVHPGRARLVQGAAHRLGVADRIEVVVVDGTRLPPDLGPADAVLVDAPCSGLGTVRRRPELRWRHDAGDPARLADLQLLLLQSAAGHVAPGGRLVYSACTWTLAETVQVVRDFAAGDGRFVPRSPRLPAVDPHGTNGMQLRPDVHDTDGMYCCVLERV